MAGHSKWANIKRQKARVDAVKGKTFTQLSRNHRGGSKWSADPAGNFQLRTAIEKRRQLGYQMKILTSDCKGAGTFGGENSNLEAVRYEGYGPGGVILIEALTDNRNRTAADLRAALVKTAVISVKPAVSAGCLNRKGSDDHWSQKKTNCWKLPGRQCWVIWAQILNQLRCLRRWEPGNPQPDAQAQRLCGEWGRTARFPVIRWRWVMHQARSLLKLIDALKTWMMCKMSPLTSWQTSWWRWVWLEQIYLDSFRRSRHNEEVNILRVFCKFLNNGAPAPTFSNCLALHTTKFQASFDYDPKDCVVALSA